MGTVPAGWGSASLAPDSFALARAPPSSASDVVFNPAPALLSLRTQGTRTTAVVASPGTIASAATSVAALHLRPPQSITESVARIECRVRFHGDRRACGGRSAFARDTSDRLRHGVIDMSHIASLA